MLVARLPEGARVVIYGAGGRGRLLELTLHDRRPDVAVLGYADTFKRGECCGLPIFAPDGLPGELDFLIVASAHADRIVGGLPESVLPKVLHYDPSMPAFDPKMPAKGHVAVATTRSSQAALMNFFNLAMLEGGRTFTAVHLDPEWTLSLWNPYLRGLAEAGRIRLVDEVGAEMFDGAYLPEYGNEHVLRFFGSTGLAGLPLCNAGLRARLRNAVLGLKARFAQLSVVEFGSICTVTGGNFSTLAIAETLAPEDRFVTVNLDAGSIRSVRSVCREYPQVEYYCGTSGEFLKSRLDSAGTIHFACLLHQPCGEPSVASEFEAMEGHIPSGGRVLFAHTGGKPANPALEDLVPRIGFETVYRDGAGWMLERR